MVVSRPEEPSSHAAPRVVAAREMLVPTVDERTYWERHTTFARFPRPIGGVMALLGGWICWDALHTLFHGGYYGVKGTLFGPVALLAGIWALLFGYPLERDGHPPGWWKLGQIASNSVSLDEQKSKSMLRLMDMLDDQDDVQNVWTNFDPPDEIDEE